MVFSPLWNGVHTDLNGALRCLPQQGHIDSLKGLDVMDIDTFDRKLSSHRGPMHGDGRGHGRAWGGIAEKTPVLWVGWIVDACKFAGVDPRRLRIAFHDVPLAMVSVRLTFGERFYWLCPICGRRCEAVYFTRRVGCLKCLHLGYASQAYRPGSVWLWMDRVFSRDFSFREGLSGRWDVDRARDFWGETIKALRGELRAELRRLVAAVTVEPLPAPEAAAAGPARAQGWGAES